VKVLDEGIRSCGEPGEAIQRWLGIAHERVAFELRHDNTRCVREFESAVGAYEKAWQLASTDFNRHYLERARKNLQRARENIKIDDYNLEAYVYNEQAEQANLKKQKMLDEAARYIEAAFGRDAAKAATSVKEDE